MRYHVSKTFVGGHSVTDWVFKKVGGGTSHVSKTFAGLRRHSSALLYIYSYLLFNVLTPISYQP